MADRHRVDKIQYAGRHRIGAAEPEVTRDDLRNLKQLIPSSGSTPNWGDIGGVLSDQTDLQNALNLKASISALATVAFSGAYADLIGRPSLATVATTGAYSDLTGRPTLGTLASLNLDTDGTMSANSDSVVPSQKAVRTYVATAVTGTLKFKAGQDCSANPNYPAASKGDVYVVTVAGKIGGASGVSVDVGDEFFATADNAGGTQAAVGSSWEVLEHNFGTAPLIAANNLSDLPSPSAARTALGLAAVASSGSASDLTIGTLAVGRGGTGATSTTGSGANVLAVGPTFNALSVQSNISLFDTTSTFLGTIAGASGGINLRSAFHAFKSVNDATTFAIVSATSFTSNVPVLTPASAAGAAGFNIPHGTAPTSPVNGDIWTTTSGVYARINGVTTGPFATSTGSGITDGTYGDVTVSSSGTLFTVTNASGRGASNVALGTNALLGVTTAVDCVAIGYWAGRYVTSANNSTFVGYLAGQGNSGGATGAGNTAVGLEALAGFSTGNQNVAVGQQTLYTVTTGSNNTAVGWCAGIFATGSSNTFLGLQTGYQILGDNNTFVGTNSGIGGASATAANNSALGFGSFQSITSGANNSALGEYAGFSLTGGNFNVLLGMYSGYDIVGGSDNIFIGYNSGRGVTSGSGNVVIGDGTTGLAAGLANNIIIKNGAGNGLTFDNTNWTLSGNIVSANIASGATVSGTNTGDQFTAMTSSRILGRATAGFGAAEQLTGAQVKTILAITESDVANLTTDLAAKAPLANPQFTGVAFYQQPNPTAKSAAATLTAAELMTLIITTSGTSFTLTLPTGTLMDSGITTAIGSTLAANEGFEWVLINTASSTITLAAGTAHTIVGTATTLTGVTSRWFTRKTAANTFVTYRIA